MTAPIAPDPAPQQPATPPAQPVTPPAAPTVPPVVPPAPAPAPPAPATPPPAQPASPPDTGDGFPANTPVAEMTPKQAAAYWKAQSRRWEDRAKAQSDYEQLKDTAQKYQELVTASQTEHEKAIADATRQGREQAITELGDQVVAEHIRAAAMARGVSEEDVRDVLEDLNLSKFHTSGRVDADKVRSLVAKFAPAAPGTPAATEPSPTTPAAQPATTPQQPAGLAAPPPRGPADFGQGQPATAPPSGLAAGAAIAAQRYAKAANTVRVPATQ